MTNEPVIGWRLWRLSRNRLRAWAVDYQWEPGENRARCLSNGGRQCEASPGRHCQCGLWAVWSPARCWDRVRGDVASGPHVMGLISGWGTVAVHGHEGFRAEVAAIRCLFVDDPPGEWAFLPTGRRLVGWWRRRSGRSVEPEPSEDVIADPERWEMLQEVAERYAVPLVSLRGALSMGLLSEWGVPRAQIMEARSLIELPG
ncbi:MAG TPA: hypothetical protein VGO86_02210 [Candidatus Dormibacteraeota bacterium]